MDYKYMVVAFLNEQPEGKTLEPPKNPHITVKKKFKLIGLNEAGLIELLKSDKNLRGTREVLTGNSEQYDSSQNMIVTVKNDGVWRTLHERLLKLLSEWSESRDTHLEGKNYLPHITWRLRGVDNFDSSTLENRSFLITHLYLIERIHPTRSIARIISKIPLEPSTLPHTAARI